MLTEGVGVASLLGKWKEGIKLRFLFLGGIFKRQ